MVTEKKNTPTKKESSVSSPKEGKKKKKPVVTKKRLSKKSIIVVSICVALLVLGNLFFIRMSGEGSTFFDDDEVFVTENGTRYTVTPDDLIASGLPKDGIPAIITPVFESVTQANAWLDDEEYVLVLVYDGVTRVYPVQIMLWHELVHDTINEQTILATYCPLCLSGKVYVREGTFGTSGTVYNGNGVMYDAETGTYWSQFEGVGLVGERAGDKLEALPLSLVTWSEFKEAHPESEVLSKNTGYRRPYGTDPYTSYYADDSLFFPVAHQSEALPLKEIVHGIVMNGVYRAYSAEVLKEKGVISDTLGEVTVRLERLSDGQIIATNQKTGDRIVHTTSFWVTWYAFNPETTVYEG